MSTISTGTTLTTAYTVTGDTTGQLVVQTGASATTALTVDTSQNTTAVGTVTATKLIPSGGSATGNGMYLPAANSLGFSTNGSERVRVDSSGNVGIGTASPGSFGAGTTCLTVKGSAGDLGRIETQGTTNAGFFQTDNVATYIGSQSNIPLLLFSNNTERMRIDASGNVGIGTTSPSGYDAKLAVFNGNFALTSTTNKLYLFYVSSTNNAYISSSTNGGMTFSNLNAERMRIDDSGYLLVGYTTSSGSYKLQVNSQIFATSSTIATSDANYKTNIQSLDGALNLVNKLNPVSFNWKKHPVHNFDTETPTVGFLAQEVQSVLADTPYVNSIIKENEVTLPDDTKEKFLGIAEGNMIALLTKAIQELKAQNDALKTRIEALESK